MVFGLAQEQPEIKPLPVVTGYGGFVTTFQPGKQVVNPIFTPILLVPVGQRILIEAEFEAESDIKREHGLWGPKKVEKEIEYVQLDYFVNRYLTVVAGRFLTPFGIFNERLHPIWIKNLQTDPLIFGMSHSSSMGAMLRGGIELGSRMNLNYAGYFSGLSTIQTLESERAAGGRWSLFFPGPRVEAGVSFSRRLGQERFNMYGFDSTWNLKAIPLDVRSEYGRSSELGSGYWIEGAYRLLRVPTWNSFFRRSQAVVRAEQFFAPSRMHGDEEEEEEEGGHHSLLPERDIQRVMFGWNFYIREGFKASFALGRSFDSKENRNIWSIGLAYRF